MKRKMLKYNKPSVKVTFLEEEDIITLSDIVDETDKDGDDWEDLFPDLY